MEGGKKVDPHGKKKKETCPARVKKKKKEKKKNLPTHSRGEKLHTWDLLFRREGEGHSQKEGIFLICDNDIPIQSAACRWML